MAASSRRANRASSKWNRADGYLSEALESRVLLSASPRTRAVYVPPPAASLIVAPPVTPTVVNPVITAVTPDAAIIGGPAFTLTVSGTNLTATGVIDWNGADLATTATSVGAGQFKLSATIPATNIAATGTATVTVKASGVISNGLSVVVRRPEVVAYLPDYSFAATFPKLDFSDVTQINYFELVPNSDGSLPATTSLGYVFDSPTSQINTLVAAAHGASPRVAVNITLGPEAPFQTIANDATGTFQNTLVTQLIAFCGKYHLDGIDMDYEPDHTLSTTDQTNYVALLTQLHNATSTVGLKLTAAVQAWQQIIPLANTGILDRYYVMDYDLLDNSTAPYDDSITYLQSWISYGIPLSKILFGVPFYGRTSDGGGSTPETYSVLFDNYYNSHGHVYPGPTLDTLTTGGQTFGYNGITTMQKKAAYALSHGLGGVMIWQLGQDHFSSTTGKYDQYSLLPSIAADVLGVVHLASSGSGTITLRQDADHAHVDWISGNWIGTFPIADADGLKLFGDGSSDTVAMDQTFGTPIPNVLHLSGTFTMSGLGGVNPFAGKTIEIGKSTVYLAYQNLSSDLLRQSVRQNLMNGYSGGTWSPLSPAGVITSVAAAADGTLKSGIGYGDSAESAIFSALPLHTIELKYVLYGDTGLKGSSGAVGFTDFMRMTQHFTASSNATWVQGDFNYDGAINNADFVLLQRTYGSTLPASAPVPEVTPAVSILPLGSSSNRVSETDQIAPKARKHRRQK